MLVATNRGRLCHAIRLPDGSWRPFRDVGPHDGRVAAAGVGGEVHVLAHAVDRVGHLVWRADGTWSDGAEVDPGAPVADLAAAGVGDDLHVLATTAAGRLVHAVRYADGSWAGFAATGEPDRVARASIT